LEEGFSAALSKQGDICRVGQANGESKDSDSYALKPRGLGYGLATQGPGLLLDSYHHPQLTHPSSSTTQICSELLYSFKCQRIVLVAAADVEAEALKAVGIVVVEEVGEALMAVAVVAPHLSTELELPEESAFFIGRLVLVIARSTARSSTK